MTMLVQPAPLPEELDRGYLGRIMRVNGYKHLKEMTDSMAAHLGHPGASRRELTVHALLSQMAGMSEVQFAQRHTTLPLRRGITSYHPEVAHGSEGEGTALNYTAMQKTYHAAYFCKDCVTADVHFHGVSYWRRDHQIPGQLWCPKHRTPLSFVSTGDPLLHSPTQFVGSGESIPYVWTEEALQNGYVQRFLDLAATFYDQPKPFSVALVVPMLNDLGRSLGFKTNPGQSRGDLISDRLRDLFPHHWLDAVFHGILEKEPGTFLHQIDGVMYLRTSASSVTAYLLVLSVLFGSADEAINALLNACSDDEPRAVRRSRRVHNLPDDNTLIDLYVEALGAHSEVMKKLEFPAHTVRKALLGLGLPTLSDADDPEAIGRVVGLRAFYLRRLSFSASAEVAGLSERKFEGLLRMCGPNLPKCLKRMNPKNSVRPRARKAKQILSVQLAATVEPVQ
ncbi:TniQ family protein [Acidovorax radicis]|uniref:TniQ family protein n=1 Tax=Acidovorax radicis TaxID=758826 RepID=UPI001CF83526|nr:TniQ family protein [Acidovorax radicis]UCU98608.1 TniQ family protein [Acidovorax radicis]